MNINLTHTEAVYLNELVERALDNDNFRSYMQDNVGDFGMDYIRRAKQVLENAIDPADVARSKE